MYLPRSVCLSICLPDEYSTYLSCRALTLRRESKVHRESSSASMLGGTSVPRSMLRSIPSCAYANTVGTATVRRKTISNRGKKQAIQSERQWCEEVNSRFICSLSGQVHVQLCRGVTVETGREGGRKSAHLVRLKTVLRFVLKGHQVRNFATDITRSMGH